jgi:hypothetical protein
MAIQTSTGSLSACPHGFVMAMRAELTCSEYPPWHEWIIVSRWGGKGEYLSLSRTRASAPAASSAPIDLAPWQTLLARMPRPPANRSSATFVLSARRPRRFNVAGEFAPAQGHVQLSCRGTRISLRAEGRWLARTLRPGWRAEAVHEPWVGEFIELSRNPVSAGFFAGVGRRADRTTLQTMTRHAEDSFRHGSDHLKG